MEDGSNLVLPQNVVDVETTAIEVSKDDFF